MPRRGTSVPSLCRHKHKKKAYVRLNGVFVWLGVWPDMERKPPPAVQSEYNRVIGEWIANGRQLPAREVDEDGVTINELVVAFWEHAQKHYRDPEGKPTSEIREYKYSLRPLVQIYGETFVHEFSTSALKACRNQFIENGNSRKVCNRRTNRLRRIFKWGVEAELVPVEVWQALTCVSGLQAGRCEAPERSAVLPVEASAVEAVLPRLRPQLRSMVELLRVAGMRPCEVCVMRSCDIDRSSAVWLYRPWRHKTQHHGKEKIIFLGPKAQEILRPWLKDDPQAYLFSPAESQAAFSAERRASRKTPMTPSQAKRKPKIKPKKAPRERYDSHAIASAIGVACDALGMTRWGPGRLRHSFGTEVRKRFGLEAAQVLLGHEQADVTQIYAERNMQLGEKVAAEIG